MEDLNKNQIILLTLLVSFVTSIATGIMTASLLQEAPIEVTRNINRIVEKTIETVVPATPTSQQKEVTTVVVKEEDQVIDSINKNIKSVVRIKERNPFTNESSFYGIGIIITKDGNIIADRKAVSLSNVYTATLNDDSSVTLIPQAVDKQTNFIMFKVDSSDKSKVVFVPAVLGDSEPKLGQSIVSLGGESNNSISVGRVVSFDFDDIVVSSTTVKSLKSVNTDISSKDVISGSPVFNLSGAIVGVHLSEDPTRSFTPVSVLSKEISTISSDSQAKKPE